MALIWHTLLLVRGLYLLRYGTCAALVQLRTRRNRLELAWLVPDRNFFVEKRVLPLSDFERWRVELIQFQEAKDFHTLTFQLEGSRRTKVSRSLTHSQLDAVKEYPWPDHITFSVQSWPKKNETRSAWGFIHVDIEKC